MLDNDIRLSGQRELETIIERRDDGVICQPSVAIRDKCIHLSKCGIPIVFFGSLPEDMTGFENTSSVTWDCAEAVETAVTHLIQTGRQRIGFIGARHGAKSDETRFQAYKKALEEAGLPADDQWIVWGSSGLPPYEKLDSIFAADGEKPDAFFVINDAVSIAVMEKLGAMGIRIPDDIALVGMGDLPISTVLGLTTVREPLEEIGRGAAELMLELIENSMRQPIHHKITCNELVVRRTSSLIA